MLLTCYLQGRTEIHHYHCEWTQNVDSYYLSELYSLPKSEEDDLMETLNEKFVGSPLALVLKDDQVKSKQSQKNVRRM